jgi:hypothetical protein
MSARADLSSRAIRRQHQRRVICRQISSILAYFSRRVFLNGLAQGLPWFAD